MSFAPAAPAPAKSKAPTGNVLIDTLLQAIDPEARNQAEKVYWEKHDVTIAREGKRIILPNDPREMPLRVAIEHLERIEEDENQIRRVVERFEGYPMDAAVAFSKAMRAIYGYATPVPTMTWFGPQPPQIVTVKTGPKDHDTTQVIIGEFKVPNIENNLETGVDDSGQFYVIGNVRKAEETVLLELAYHAKQFLRKESIYRGKAIEMKVGKGGSLYRGMEPTFIDTDKYDPKELILRRDVEDDLDRSLFAHIKFTDRCRKAQIPLKRGILLSGIYGTGKSMTASITSRLCVENGWTFILLDKVQGLKAALEFANQYAPAVVFAEDIDRITGQRDDAANDLLNTIDGVVQKGSEVMTVLTTNHIENINRAMLRPGRLDAIIEVKTPDAEAVERLLRLYGRGLIAEATNLTEISQRLAGMEMIPASIREVAERAKSSMILFDRESISVEDLDSIYRAMAYHMKLLRGPEKEEVSVQHAAGLAIQNLIGSGTTDPELIKKVTMLEINLGQIGHLVGHVADKVGKLGKLAEESAKANGKTLDNLASKEQANKILKAVTG